MRALEAAHSDDEFFPAFKQRVVDVLEHERPAAAIVPPPLGAWDRPTEHTVRLVPQTLPAVTQVVGPAAPRARSARG